MIYFIVVYGFGIYNFDFCRLFEGDLEYLGVYNAGDLLIINDVAFNDPTSLSDACIFSRTDGPTETLRWELDECNPVVSVSSQFLWLDENSNNASHV